MAAPKKYTEAQKEAFCAYAQENGIGRAIREMKYPSYPTALDWCKARGIKPSVDQLMANVKAYHTFYEVSDALLITEEGLKRVLEKYTEDDLDADELKKVSEAHQKLINTWQVLQGKASNITESHTLSPVDADIQRLIAEMNTVNEEVNSQ